MSLTVLNKVREKWHGIQSRRHLTHSVKSENGMGQHYTDASHPVVRRSVALAQETDAKDILDLGAGRGLTSLALAKESGARINATDINDIGLAELRDSASAQKLPVSTQVFNTTDTLPRPWENRFDMVVAKDVLPFLPPGDVQPFLDNIARALRPGGWALVTAPSTRSRLCQEATPVDSLNDGFSRRLGQAAKDFIQTTVERFNFENPKHLAEELDNAGLELTEVQPFGRAKGWLWAIAQKPES